MQATLAGSRAMPAPLHVQLSSHQHRRLRELRRDPALRPRERDRVEMYLLSADGMTVPRLALEAEGLKAVRHKRRGLGPNPAAVPQAHLGRSTGRGEGAGDVIQNLFFSSLLMQHTRCWCAAKCPPPNRLEGWFGHFKPRACMTRGLKTETGALNFVRLMARDMT